jgi:hypothetical protein
VKSLQRKWGTTKHDSATTFTHLPLELEAGKDSSKEMQCNKHNDVANVVGKYRDVGTLECEFRVSFEHLLHRRLRTTIHGQVHCWLLSRDIFQWSGPHEEVKTSPHMRPQIED